MRNTREILRLKYEAGLSHRMIARAVGVANSTVSDVSARMKVAGLVWQDVAGLSDIELERRLYRDHEKRTVDPREPDWSRVRAEIAGDKHVTLQLLWAEYRRGEPDGYGYSWYCERYRAWQGTLDLVMRQEHRYGERLFVDWAGDTMGVVTPGTGEVRPAYLFVAVMGASNYLYAETSFSCGTHEFLSAHSRAFSYFGGVPELVVCDNLKTGVRKPDRYEPRPARPLRRAGGSLRVRGVPRPSAQAPRQGQGGERSARGLPHDHGTAAQARLLLAGRTQRSDRHARGRDQRASLPKAAWVQTQRVP